LAAKKGYKKVPEGFSHGLSRIIAISGCRDFLTYDGDDIMEINVKIDAHRKDENLHLR
jgi:hypothetical protein